jgi:hypothetical protein
VHEDHLGPVDYVVVAFSESSAVRAGFDRLLELVDAGLIRVLDLEFVTNADGVARTVPASQAGPEFSLFEGAASGLLDCDDLDAVAARLAPGATAAVLVYEELSILRVIQAWEPPVPESFPKAPSTSTSSTLDCKEHDHEPASRRRLCRGRQLGARPYSAPPARSLGRRGSSRRCTTGGRTAATGSPGTIATRR